MNIVRICPNANSASWSCEPCGVISSCFEKTQTVVSPWPQGVLLFCIICGADCRWQDHLCICLKGSMVVASLRGARGLSWPIKAAPGQHLHTPGYWLLGIIVTQPHLRGQLHNWASHHCSLHPAQAAQAGQAVRSISTRRAATQCRSELLADERSRCMVYISKGGHILIILFQRIE